MKSPRYKAIEQASPPPADAEPAQNAPYKGPPTSVEEFYRRYVAEYEAIRQRNRERERQRRVIRRSAG